MKMTKFERAKKQTIEHWESRLDAVYGIGEKPRDSCGFCDYYKCGSCPVGMIEPYGNCIPILSCDPTAVLIYVHQLQDPAKEDLKLREKIFANYLHAQRPGGGG